MIRYWIISICTVFGTVSVSTDKESVKDTVITADMISVIPSRIVVDRVEPFVEIETPTEVPIVKKVKKVKGEQSCPQFEEAFRSYGLVPVDVFSYIAYRESRCRIKAINIKLDKHGNVIWALNSNGSYDSGLLQINSTWVSVTREVCNQDISALLTLDCNLKVAKYLLDNGGLHHWGM